MSDHLPVLPLLIPLFAGLMIMLETRQRRRVRRFTGLAATVALLPVTWLLWGQASVEEYRVYQLGNWPAPFGIVLILDRLAALMLLITAILAVPVYLYACRGDDGIGVNFHALFQFLLLGVNGAFLTGDLFNLFVFFEVLLLSSYALLMHGHGPDRARAGLHYVILNLTGSAIFLFGLGLVYGATGTLNMADVGRALAAGEVLQPALFAAAISLLLVVFALKAALLPLGFWLPAAYGAASPPVAAMFAIMSKVGLYAIWRLWSLVMESGEPALAARLTPWLTALGLISMLVGSLGVLAATRLSSLASWLLLMSVGTLTVVLVQGDEAAWAAGLFYLLHSTWGVAALFLLAGLIARLRGPEADYLRSGEPLPTSIAVTFLVVAVMLVGLPPLSGFLGKVLMLATLPLPAFWVLLLAGGLASLIALSRAGSTLFWRTEPARYAQRRSAAGLRSLLMLVAVCMTLVVFASGWLAITQQVAEQLLQPDGYIEAVLPSGRAR
ncbi:MAG: monovalent cation/H+ antiporter subunit D [Gammaproteobacteria bacterium HGW-Gammaproteobacteria-14]|nr:MAG: monovalent cation/H+ antiporter subunit D [Gammaproteobacteria bacterium HGW-Gammaproteobacteria-14]